MLFNSSWKKGDDHEIVVAVVQKKGFFDNVSVQEVKIYQKNYAFEPEYQAVYTITQGGDIWVRVFNL